MRRRLMSLITSVSTKAEMEWSDTDSEEHSSDCSCDECVAMDPDYVDDSGESEDETGSETGDESGCDNTDSEIDFY